MAAATSILRRLGRPVATLWRRLLLNHWKAIDEEVRAAKPREGYDWRPIVVLVTVAISLTLQEYWGQRAHYREFFPRGPGDEYYELRTFAWWTGWRFFGYVVLPVVVILLMPGERLRDYFIRFTGFIKHIWIYLTLFALIAPVIWLASKTAAFQATYPFYKLANRSSFDFWAWEGMYALQFLSLEFFFRGFILRGLRDAFASKAIFVMAVPYCMIHYGKPMPETIGAIFAGIILGTLAMRTKTIWGGVAIHVCVATMMDSLAVGHCPPADSGLSCRGH
jgi:membrane protease YdiL (CAAX protease family)